MHGYLLKKVLSPALPRGEQVNDGILYPLLARLERDKLVKKRAELVGGRSRNVYRVTAAGRRAFETWLRGDDNEADRVTYDFFVGEPFLTKCLFFNQLAPEEAGVKFETQRDATKERLQTLEAIRSGMVERKVDPFRIAIIDLGIERTEVMHRWLSRMARRSNKARPSRKRRSQ